MILDSPRNCLTFNLQRAARSLVRGFEDCSKAAGLTAPQFTTLSLLSGHGTRSVGDLAEDLGTERTTLTRNLTLMARHCWIDEVAAEDKRMRVWRLTEAGRLRLGAALPAWRDWQASLVDRLGPDAARALLMTLQKL